MISMGLLFQLYARVICADIASGTSQSYSAATISLPGSPGTIKARVIQRHAYVCLSLPTSETQRRWIILER